MRREEWQRETHASRAIYQFTMEAQRTGGEASSSSSPSVLRDFNGCNFCGPQHGIRDRQSRNDDLRSRSDRIA